MRTTSTSAPEVADVSASGTSVLAGSQGCVTRSDVILNLDAARQKEIKRAEVAGESRRRRVVVTARRFAGAASSVSAKTPRPGVRVSCAKKDEASS